MELPAKRGVLRMSRRDWGASALLALVYTATGLAGLQLALFHSQVTTFWPPSGIALAALLLFGPRLLPGVWLGAFAVNLLWTGNPLGALGVGIGNTAAAWVGWVMLRRVGFDARLVRLRDAADLLVYGALLDALIAALLGPASLYLLGPLPAADLPRMIFLWWAGDAIGILLIAPLILTLPALWREHESARRTIEGSVILALQIGIAVVIFSGLLEREIGLSQVNFLLLPLGILLALRHAPGFTALANTVIFVVAGAGTKSGMGPFDPAAMPHGWLVFHLAAVFFFCTTLLISTLSRERTLALLSARQNTDRFRSLTELSSDWYWEQDENLRFTFVSASASGRAGFGGNTSLGKTRFELPNSFLSEQARIAHEADLAGRRPFRDLVLKRLTPEGEARFALVSGEPLFDKEGVFRGYRGVGRDITALKRTEERLERLRDFYAGLSEVNELIARRPARIELFRKVCGIVVERSGIEFARIAMREAETQRVSTVAHAGNDYGLAQQLYFSLDPQALGGSAPSARALRNRTHFVCNDLRSDGQIFLRDLLLDAGMLSAATFPLVLQEQAVGALHLYSKQPQFFDAELIGLLDRLALNLSFALENMEREGARENAERAVHEARRFFETVLNAIASPIVVKDEAHRFVAFNDSAVEFLGRPREWMIGKTDFDLFPAERARFLQETDIRALTSGQPVEYEAIYHVRGKEHTMLVHKTALNRGDGTRVLVLVMTDISERKAAEDALRASEQRFRDVAEVAGEYLWENDLEGRFTYLSPKVVEVLGYSAEELVGRAPAEIMPPGEAERVRQWLAEHMGPDRRFRDLEHQIVARSGETLWLQVSGVPTFDEQGQQIGHRGTTRDITELKRSEARISYLATRDPLTALPNRLLFNDRLEQGLINARRAGDSLGVVFIDLDRFKNINDSLGHHVGDLLLTEVAQRMSACIRRGDTLARLGGDEFVIALEHLKRAEDAAQVANKLVRALSRPIEVGAHTLNTSCSIGISIYPNDADDAVSLMKNADTAMYYAKEKGRNNFQFFSPEMNVRAVERHKLEVSLRRALERRDFVLLYQPQLSIKTGKVIGAEALIRWNDPERGLVAPSGFIAVAEESGLIEPIGRWVLSEACSQVRRWRDQGLPAVRVAVNISPRQLVAPKEFLAYVNQVLDEVGLEPRLLELEMTESLLLTNVEENAAILRKLGKLGVRIAVDDFGTGYSSLAYLKQLPIDSLKIDRTFVRDIESDPEDAAIIQAIIAMAHGLKLKVTAEGVETAGQLKALRALGCDQFQGFLFAKPLTAAEFAARLVSS